MMAWLWGRKDDESLYNDDDDEHSDDSNSYDSDDDESDDDDIREDDENSGFDNHNKDENPNQCASTSFTGLNKEKYQEQVYVTEIATSQNSKESLHQENESDLSNPQERKRMDLSATRSCHDEGISVSDVAEDPSLDLIATENNRRKVTSESSIDEETTNDGAPVQGNENSKSINQYDSNGRMNNESISNGVIKNDKPGEEKEETKSGATANDDLETTFSEKVAVLALAAEHDRVDILQAILNPPSLPPKNTAANLVSTDTATQSSLEKQPITAGATKDDVLVVGGTKTLPSEDNVHDVSNTSPELSERQMLLNPCPSAGIPPLHIAVSYGSINAVNCLLRIGADPSIRPDVDAIISNQEQQNNKDNSIRTTNSKNASSNNTNTTIIRYDDLSAWELVYGIEGDDVESMNTTKWSLFTTSSSTLEEKNDDINNKIEAGSQKKRRKVRKKKYTVDLIQAKKDMIRHAFTAEALRSIGSDEHDRLQQLLDAGMPRTIEIGNKALYQWSLDMNATECQRLLASNPEEQQEQPNENGDKTKDVDSELTDPMTQSENKNVCAVLERRLKMDDSTIDGFSVSTYQLQNRYDELQSLSQALSTCLDNLAEEVSVCSGLLLTSSGNNSASSSLASHVRSLKATKDRKFNEVQHHEIEYENVQDELAYWIEECWNQFCYKEEQRAIDDNVPQDIDFGEQLDLMEEHLLSTIALLHDSEQQYQKSRNDSERRFNGAINCISEHVDNKSKEGSYKTITASDKSFDTDSIGVNATHSDEIGVRNSSKNVPKIVEDDIDDNDDDVVIQRQHQLRAQILSSESRIRQLRSSISDLSEENARNLNEVERRGLLGGINLVRTLRGEIREIDFNISEIQSAIQDYQIRIKRLQHLYDHKKDVQLLDGAGDTSIDNTLTMNDINSSSLAPETQKMLSPHEENDRSNATRLLMLSEQRHNSTSGEESLLSTSTDLTNDAGSSNVRLFTLWKIILRMIGIGNSRTLSSHSAYHAPPTNRDNPTGFKKYKEDRLVMIV